jgi:aminopeptidase N
MEHPANVVVREDLPDVQRLYANVPLHTVLHEIAHQWAGNRTTLAHRLDFVWKEAISEYLVYVFEQDRRPAPEAATTRTVWHDIGNGSSYPVRPLADPDLPLSVWVSGGYGSGPMALFVQL